MASCTLIVGVLKYFLIFGGFVRFYSDPLVLSSYGAFVHLCFSLSAHMVAGRECWLFTPVSCDHGIVYLDCWSIKIFSHFWWFCPLWFWSFWAFVLWCFCPFNVWKMNCYVLYGSVKKVLCPLWPTVNGTFMFFVPKVAIKKVFLLLVWLLQSNCLLVV